MTARRPNGYFLIQMVMVVSLIGIITGMAGYSLNQTLQINRRTTAWANDDAIVREILRHVRRDVAAATEAELANDKITSLILRRPKRGIRYEITGQTVRRVEQRADDSPTKRQWSLRRTRLGFSIETSNTGSTMVWTTVDLLDHKRPPKPPERQYACAARVGSLPVAEDLP